MFDRDSIIQRSSNISDCNLGDELALMSLETGTYYTLNSVSKKIWELLEEPKSISNIITFLMKEYEVSEEECCKDVLDFLDEIKNKSLILTK